MKLEMKREKKLKIESPNILVLDCFSHVATAIRTFVYYEFMQSLRQLKNNRSKCEPPKPKDERKRVTCECHKSIEFTHHRQS